MRFFQLVQYQEQGEIAFKLLVKSQLMEQPINLSELMKYALTPVPHSLGTPDGFLAKTDKSKIVHYLTHDVPENVAPPTDNVIYILDGNAIIHMMKDLPPTFGLICLKLLDIVTFNKKDVIFSTDSYHPNSIKSQERLRRGVSEKLHISGTSTRKPADMKVFLQNDENKAQLFDMLLKVWVSDDAVEKLEGHQVTLVVNGVAHQLQADGNKCKMSEIHTLRSNQEETDTRIILYLQHAEKEGYQSAVVRSPDSDIFFILLYYAHQLQITVFFDTGTGKHRRLLNITETAQHLGKQYTDALLGIYCFTGEDCTSSFKGKGKLGPLRKLQKYPRFQEVFAQLGSEWDLDTKVQTHLEAFTCIMYGHARVTNVDEVRTLMLKKMVGEDEALTEKSKVDLSRLPPCRRSLYPHVKRVNLRVGQWKRSHIPIYEMPLVTDHGWVWNEEGHLEPLWSDGPVLPLNLVDLLDKDDTDNLPEDESSDDENDIEDLLAYLDYDSDNEDD